MSNDCQCLADLPKDQCYDESAKPTPRQIARGASDDDDELYSYMFVRGWTILPLVFMCLAICILVKRRQDLMQARHIHHHPEPPPRHPTVQGRPLAAQSVAVGQPVQGVAMQSSGMSNVPVAMPTGRASSDPGGSVPVAQAVVGVPVGANPASSAPTHAVAHPRPLPAC